MVSLRGHRDALKLLPLALSLWILSGEAFAQDGGMAPAPVVVTEATEQMLAPVIWFPATVISRNDARLAAAEEGRLVQVADVGTRVAKGDVVARIDDGLLRRELAEDKAEVEGKRTRLEYFQREVNRLEELATGNNVAQNQLDEALSNRGVTRSELLAAEARVAQREERLRRVVVTAPYAGVITERRMQVGEWASSGDALVRLVDSSTLEVQSWVPVNALSFIKQGTALEVASKPRNVEGVVRTIVPVGDDRSKLYELRLSVADKTWPAGQTLRVAIPSEAPRSVVAVPRDALVLRRSGTTIYRILDDDTAEGVPVTIEVASGDLIGVSGIQPGDRVVTRGGERLRTGQAVQAMDAPVNQ